MTAPEPDKSFCWRCHGFRLIVPNGAGVTMPAKCGDWERCRGEALAIMGPAPGLSSPDRK
jgi:hypothetical protein